MFNVFLHDKLSTEAETAETIHKKNLQSLSVQSKIRDRLVKKNRIRIKDRLLQMSADPVPISRKDFPVKLPTFKGEKFFRFRPRDSNERIKDAEIASIWLDTIPILPSPHNFRPRHKNKEIHSDMKFTPKDRYERVTDTWESQRGMLNSSWEVKSKDASERFPNTMRKSYYKTVESVALDLTPGKALHLPMVNGRGPSTEPLPDVQTDRTLAQVAQEVMEKCKLKPLKEEINSPYQSRSASLPLKQIN